VIVCFVDIGGIDDHHSFNFVFIMLLHSDTSYNIQTPKPTSP